MTSQTIPLLQRLAAAESPRSSYDWQDREGYYLGACRVSADDVPGLLELVRKWSARDWPDETDVPLTERMQLLPVTAWRALADLKADPAVQPLVDILCEFDDLFEGEFDDWTCEELPYFFGKIGHAAIEPLMRLATNGERGNFIRTIATTGLQRIVEYWPETRQQIVAYMTQMMENSHASSHEFNATLLVSLVDLQAVEAAEAIERAFAADRIDVSMMGTWEDVRKELDVPGLGLEMPARPYHSIPFLTGHQPALHDDPELSQWTPPDGWPGGTIVREFRAGRNDPCPCGSGKKFKKCCGGKRPDA